MLTITKLKIIAKYKKSDLTKDKKLIFINIISFERDFFIFEAKKTFAYLQKNFIIFYYF